LGRSQPIRTPASPSTARATVRARPDGRLLKWKTLNLADDHNGILPFFIEWDATSTHPSTDSPAGCQLEGFAIADPDPTSLKRICEQLGLEVPVESGKKTELRARIAGAKGRLEMTS
jgi:hypothetical protein